MYIFILFKFVSLTKSCGRVVKTMDDLAVSLPSATGVTGNGIQSKLLLFSTKVPFYTQTYPSPGTKAVHNVKRFCYVFLQLSVFTFLVKCDTSHCRSVLL